MSQSHREWRRIHAYHLRQKGWTEGEIAAAVGVTRGAVSQWLKRAKEGGMEALRDRERPGAPCRLSAEEKGQLCEVLRQGAVACGFLGEFWTGKRIAELIFQRFGVRYHPYHVRRLLKELGWTLQTPARRATQRDEKAIRTWREKRWSWLKKKPEEKVES